MRLPQRVVLTVVLLCAVAMSARAETAQLSIAFEGNVVTISGVSHRGQIVLFSIAREPQGAYSKVVRRETLLDPPGNGDTVSWDLGAAIPLKSVWCAVDLSSGDFATASPAAFGLRPIPLSSLGFPRDQDAQLAFVTVDRPMTNIFLVRPHGGAWVLRVVKGGTLDEDRANHNAGARGRFDRMTGIVGTKAPAPSKIEQNDVVVVVDTSLVEIWAGNIGREVHP